VVARILHVTLATALLVVLGAGCGGSERLEYERDLAKVGRVVDDSLEALPDDDAETIGAEHVGRIADDLREAADQLADLDPPDDATRAQARLERGLRGVATAFDELASRLEDANTDARKAELFVQFATDEDVDAAFDDVIGAQEAYAQQGYRVFGTARPARD
jgi:hypothetical protein